MKTKRKAYIPIWLAILAPIAFATIAGGLYWHFRPTDVPVATSTIPQDAQAAMQGTEAYYTINYAETADQWADRVCLTLATETDCTLTRMLLAPEIYGLAQRHQIQTGSTVYPIEMVYEYPDGLSRVWKIQVTFTNPWEGAENPLTVYAVVDLNEETGSWAMQHIMFNVEAQALEQILAEGTPQP